MKVEIGVVDIVVCKGVDDLVIVELKIGFILSLF